MSKKLTLAKKWSRFIFTLFLGSPALAQVQGSSFLETFSSQAQVIPLRLKAQGKTQIGDVNVDHLLEEMKLIRWQQNVGGFLAGSGDARTGAIYFVSSKTVILNTNRQMLEPRATMPAAALHEALGALGYQDENYELSLVLQMNSYADQEQKVIFPKEVILQQNEFLQKLKRRTQDHNYKSGSGGGTSVGGGGDGVVVQIKSYALIFAQPICENLKMSCKDIHSRILKAKIEVSPKILNENVYLEKQGEQSVLRVPLVRWVNGNILTQEVNLSTDQLLVLKDVIQTINKDF